MSKTKLDEIATIQVGYQSKQRINENRKGSHRLIQGKDFDSLNCLKTESLVRFVPVRRPELYAVTKGDILFMARGARNFAFYVAQEMPNTLVSGSFYLMRTHRQDIVPAYLAWWLNQTPAQEYFRAASAGATMAFVSKSALSELPVEVSPIAVQKQIVRINALWMRERSIREALVRQRERLIQSMTLQTIESKE